MKIVLLLFVELFFISSLFSEIYANYNDNKVEIYWSKSTNTKIQHFIIERSKDGIEFETLRQINSGNGGGYYFEIDYQPPIKMAYYRIKQVDFNRNYNYSKTVMVKNYNKLSHSENFNKSLKGYKGRNILVVLKNKKGKEFYLKVDVTEYKKELYAMPNINLNPDKYLIIATTDDLLLNKKINIIDRQDPIDSYYSQNRE